MAGVEVMTAARSAREVLASSRNTVDPALRAAVDTLPASMRRIVAYHFGWWDEHGRPEAMVARPSVPRWPCWRPRLLAAVPAAAAVELVHNHSLVHDDVLDGDLTAATGRSHGACSGSTRRSWPGTPC
jgi:geranylgeranyl diphosphate synthase, type I